jgi:hypothetical protein
MSVEKSAAVTAVMAAVEDHVRDRQAHPLTRRHAYRREERRRATAETRSSLANYGWWVGTRDREA